MDPDLSRVDLIYGKRRSGTNAAVFGTLRSWTRSDGREKNSEAMGQATVKRSRFQRNADSRQYRLGNLPRPHITEKPEDALPDRTMLADNTRLIAALRTLHCNKRHLTRARREEASLAKSTETI
jgi:hypothetical protein